MDRGDMQYFSFTFIATNKFSVEIINPSNSNGKTEGVLS